MRRRTFLGLTALAAVAPVLTEKVICGVDWGLSPDYTITTYVVHDADVTIKLIGTSSGRFSSASPNFGNIPRVG